MLSCVATAHATLCGLMVAVHTYKKECAPCWCYLIARRPELHTFHTLHTLYLKERREEKQRGGEIHRGALRKSPPTMHVCTRLVSDSEAHP